MEVVSHSLLTSLAENGFGISLLTKEFIKDKLNKINTNIKIPKRNLVYALKQTSVETFTTKKFIEILKENK